MYLTKNFVVPTLNFEPYFQKPPMLFWLVNLAWTLFGVSRAAALIVVFAASSLVIYLTDRLARSLFPGQPEITDRIPWLVFGNVVFLIYASLILFDLLLTVFVLASLLSLIEFSKSRKWRYSALAGLFIGLGLITKGPVVLIHIVLPVILYWLWPSRERGMPTGKFFAGAALALLVALIPVAMWLAPAVAATGIDFFYDLVWKQASGRVSGTLHGAHARPFYFYLMLLPVILLPWGLAPEIWRSATLKRIRETIHARTTEFHTLAFLLAWALGVLAIFSLISGKQPHYLVPVLPAVSILLAYVSKDVPFSRIKLTAFLMLGLFGIGQAIAASTFFDRVDFGPLARFISERRDADWAFSGDYQGQIEFLARTEKPFVIVRHDDVDAWLQAHPDGYLIEQQKRRAATSKRAIFTLPILREQFVVWSGSK